MSVRWVVLAALGGGCLIVRCVRCGRVRRVPAREVFAWRRCAYCAAAAHE